MFVHPGIKACFSQASEKPVGLVLIFFRVAYENRRLRAFDFHVVWLIGFIFVRCQFLYMIAGKQRGFRRNTKVRR